MLSHHASEHDRLFRIRLVECHEAAFSDLFLHYRCDYIFLGFLHNSGNDFGLAAYGIGAHG